MTRLAINTSTHCCWWFDKDGGWGIGHLFVDDWVRIPMTWQQTRRDDHFLSLIFCCWLAGCLRLMNFPFFISPSSIAQRWKHPRWEQFEIGQKYIKYNFGHVFFFHLLLLSKSYSIKFVELKSECDHTSPLRSTTSADHNLILASSLRTSPTNRAHT